MEKDNTIEPKELTESQKIFCNENFELINQYKEAFQRGVISVGTENFEHYRNKVILYSNIISNKFNIKIDQVCRFAFGYQEQTHLLQGVFTKRSEDHLYFITNGRHIKIGRTNNPARRIVDLQVSSPDKLQYIKVFHYRGDYEFRIHAIFKSIRLKGEWFKDDGQIRSYIRLLFLNNPDLSHEALFYGEY